MERTVAASGDHSHSSSYVNNSVWTWLALLVCQNSCVLFMRLDKSTIIDIIRKFYHEGELCISKVELNKIVCAAGGWSINHIRALKHIRSSLMIDMARTVACALVNSRLDYANSVLYGRYFCCGKHCETTARTERISPSRHIQEASWSYSPGARKPPLAAYKLLYRLQGGFTCPQSTVYWQASLSPSIDQRLHAYQTASVIKAAFVTEGSHQWELKIARRAFSQAAPTINWNDLPLDSRSAETYERFRSATKKHFYELAFTN